MTYVPTVRRPTGVPAAPLVMVSGPPKSGKSLLSYKLGLSKRISNCWVCDLGEGSADEYGGDDGGYEILDWGRSWSDLTDTVRWTAAQPVPDGLMNAVVIDSGSELWDGLKVRADKRARNSKKNRAALADDPDFEVDISMPFWNDAKEVWARCVSPLKLTPKLVGVVIVRSDLVAEVKGGVPTGRIVTSYAAEKTLQAVATAHVAIDMNHTARLIEVRSKLLSVTGKGLELDDANPLDDLLTRLSPTGEFQGSDAKSPIDDQRDDPEMLARIEELWQRVKATADTPLADKLRSWAKEHDKAISPTTLADIDWFVAVREWLDQHTAQPKEG